MALVCLQRGLNTWKSGPTPVSRLPSLITDLLQQRHIATSNVLLKEVFKRDKPHMNIGKSYSF